MPMVYTNCESWISISRKTLRVLDGIFKEFSQKMWRVSSGCPIPNYFWVMGCLRSSNFILQRKPKFAHHLANLPPESLGRAFFDIQMNRSLEEENLFKEVEEHSRKIGVRDLKEVSKGIWKREVNKYIREKQKKELLQEMEKYKKLDHQK